MKNALTRKLTAVAAAIAVVVSLSGCFAAPQNSDPAPSAPVSSADTVSGADAVVLDDATASKNAIEAYLNAFNTGDAAALADVTCSPAIAAFLESNGKDKAFLADSFAATIDGMKQSAGGTYHIDYNYTIADATEDQLTQLKTEVEALSLGSGEKIQAARVCKVTMKASSVASASDVTSSGDLVSGADVTEMENTDTEMRLYKYDGKWYVFAV